MKKLIAIGLLLLNMQAFSQSFIPQTSTFSATIEDLNGQPFANTSVDLRLTIFLGPVQFGIPVYCAEHETQSDNNGQVSIQFNRGVFTEGCNGAINQDFENIPWEVGSHWLQIEFRTPTTGFYSTLGEIELSSSFYAFASQTAEVLMGVNLTNAAHGDVLMYDTIAEQWQPASILDSLVAVPQGTISGQTLYWTGSTWASSNIVSINQGGNSVGIGTTTPSPSAKLDVTSSGGPNGASMGFGLPVVNTLQMQSMESFYNDMLPEGLMVYEKDYGHVWIYRYDSPTPQNPPYGNWVKLLPEDEIQATASQSTPTGIISMWSGTIGTIPSGYALCDGSNGTPDLTDKFIVSVASAAENPGASAVPSQYVNVENGTTVSPDRRFFKLAYIMKL